MTKPQDTDTIVVAVTGSLDNGEIFYTVEKDAPISHRIGDNSLPPTLEEAIRNMSVGDQQKVRVPPEEGFGPRQKDLVQTIDNPEMIKRLQPKPGMIISLKTEKDGEKHEVPATVVEVDGTKVTVDYNHPLAGHHLTYRVELLDVQKSNE
ncbi:MAG: FKBP-type peptidyl-prolyl cis-trans isomerase SlpA [Desulforhopalus sp.]|jgi:FKBP-type peptidyl-prolyl cis-trans isomerase SlpA